MPPCDTPRQCPYLKGAGISLCLLPARRGKAFAMEGESSGVQQAQGQVEQGENQRQGGQEPGVDAQSGQKQDQQKPQKDAVSGGDTDYAAQLKAKDAEIEALISWLCAKSWCQHHG